jgi:hypothetical protein
VPWVSLRFPSWCVYAWVCLDMFVIALCKVVVGERKCSCLNLPAVHHECTRAMTLPGVPSPHLCPGFHSVQGWGSLVSW